MFSLQINIKILRNDTKKIIRRRKLFKKEEEEDNEDEDDSKLKKNFIRIYLVVEDACLESSKTQKIISWD